jgi:hypothetical protein
MKTKYVEIMTNSYGDWLIAFVESTLSKIENDLENPLAYGYSDPYAFIIIAPEDKIANREYLRKQKIIDTREPLKFMIGWTINRALKKIVAENKRLKAKLGNGYAWKYNGE